MPLPLRLIGLIVFFATSLVNPLSLVGQSAFEDTGFGVEVYPHLSNRRLLGGSSVTIDELQRIDSLERADFGYGLGLFYAQRVERIGFHLGARYLRTGYAVGEQELVTDPPEDVPITFTENFRAEWLEVPFQLNFYQNFGSNTSFYFTLGLTGAINLRSRLERTTNFPSGGLTERIDEEVSYRAVHVGMLAAMGVERRFNGLTLGLQPTFEYFLTTNTLVDSPSDLTRNLYTLGLRLTAQLSTY